MKIIFSNHANSQRIKRKIPKKDILATIKNPTGIDRSYRNRQLCRRKFGGKILEVVIFKEKSQTIIVTGYYLEESDL